MPGVDDSVPGVDDSMPGVAHDDSVPGVVHDDSMPGVMDDTVQGVVVGVEQMGDVSASADKKVLAERYAKSIATRLAVSKKALEATCPKGSCTKNHFPSKE